MRNYAAEDFRAQIADKTKAAMLMKARAGRVIGKLPYGYDLKRVGDGKGSYAEYVVNETEKATVQRIFTLAAGGTGNRRIVNILADEKVSAPGRAGWSKQIIARMLNNRIYVGEVVFGRTCADAVGGHSKKRARVTDESKWTTVQVPVLRIISDTLWKQVQKRRAATLERFGSHRGADGRLNGKPEAGLIAAHLLNGFTVCGVCGGALTFMSKGKGKGAYRCQRRNSRGLHACSNAWGVPEAALNRAVMAALYKLIRDPKALWRLYLERAERWKQERALTVDVRANLEAEEQRLEQAIERLLDHLEAGEDVGLRLKQRRAELDTLRVRLAEPEPVVESGADFQKTVHDLTRSRSSAGIPTATTGSTMWHRLVTP